MDRRVFMSRFLRVNSKCYFSFTILCFLCAAAVAMDGGTFANEPDEIRGWFKNSRLLLVPTEHRKRGTLAARRKMLE